MPDGEFDPRAWWPATTWAVESLAEALARAPEFGRRFLVGLTDRFPEVAAGAVFLRWSVQPGDVYAVLSCGNAGLGLQIDADLEYLIVWDGVESAEFGHWESDPVPQALDFMASLIESAE